MKVKLLKKIRKNYKITHYPKGFVRFNESYDYNLFVLTDERYGTEWYAQLGGRDRKWCSDVFDTEKECIDFLKNKIIEKLIDEGYRNRKMRQKSQVSKVVWYVK